MLSVNSLTFAYPNGKRLAFSDFNVARGQHTLLLGESGSGKTTLLHLLGGLMRGYSGVIKLDQIDLSALADDELDTFRGRTIGFIFQKLHLVRSLNVRRNLAMSPWLAGATGSAGRVESVLSLLNLKDKIDSDVSSLSQGQAQRVAIGRAVINKPAFILADEPTSALDDRNCEDVLKLLISTADEAGSTLVIATHDHRLTSRIQNQIHIGPS